MCGIRNASGDRLRSTQDVLAFMHQVLNCKQTCPTLSILESIGTHICTQGPKHIYCWREVMDECIWFLLDGKYIVTAGWQSMENARLDPGAFMSLNWLSSSWEASFFRNTEAQQVLLMASYYWSHYLQAALSHEYPAFAMQAQQGCLAQVHIE